MGPKKTVPAAPVIPVRNPQRELYELIYAEESVTWCMAQGMQRKIRPKERTLVGKLVKKVFKPSRFHKNESRMPRKDAKNVTSRLHHTSSLRFVRRLYPEDDENHGYSGDDEESGDEEEEEAEEKEEDEKKKKAKNEDWGEAEEVDSNLTSLDLQASEFVSFPDLPDGLESCNSGAESDVDSLEAWDESMSDQQLSAWMAKANAEVVAVAAHATQRATGLSSSVFKVPPEAGHEPTIYLHGFEPLNTCACLYYLRMFPIMHEPGPHLRGGCPPVDAAVATLTRARAAPVTAPG
ncbi:hypothetical protein EDB81DRAFT_889875 [Dactylonectria macrodidyma]|uniref:Uncharacterized protein n=1 Tax=Dactylonectria macrodidyma TaxID=307937 RepID=A0A9P9DVS9_9HYPO|nr:hypothetical protein EDB81DRAFT_889875 [Dactylonectria macrodidyma]